MAKVDLHVHSKHSNQPSEWYLRRLGAPESFTEPLEIYRRCRARGMDFVTISDHDTIAGAMEIRLRRFRSRWRGRRAGTRPAPTCEGPA